ncbi:iron ABC transporter permease [Corallincola holothuriorum]|uniref:Iron ABC transporter permease n=1 Tax=Corallincola holothuriorum TaxID=2282215 RepID=A0A368N876_9GAMM|nr:iron ABC transporter permease [Corallincola holothuriorum]RCU45765.1 iron ABC transporter permease [Corallincola holothuriorum]
MVGAALSLVSGAMPLPASESIKTLFDAVFGGWFEQPMSQLAPYQQVIVLELRLPRLLLAICVGATLAQCGTVMQGLFRNPLADPGIIGVSSGAAVGAILAIVVFPAAWGAWTIPTAAFVMGLLTTLLVYGLAQSSQGTSVLILLLAGVAIAAFAGAAIGFLSYFADDQSLRELSVWQMGSLAGAGQANLWLAFVTMLAVAFAFQRRAGALNAMLLGEAEARHLGIAVERLKLELIVLCAIGVGVTVACAGIIGFIGLVVPHLVRLTTGPDHRALLPLSALLGACLLVTADLLARILVQPAELPVGLLTALLGAPFFLALLIQQRKRWG